MSRMWWPNPRHKEALDRHIERCYGPTRQEKLEQRVAELEQQLAELAATVKAVKAS